MSLEREDKSPTTSKQARDVARNARQMFEHYNDQYLSVHVDNIRAQEDIAPKSRQQLRSGDLEGALDSFNEIMNASDRLAKIRQTLDYYWQESIKNEDLERKLREEEYKKGNLITKIRMRFGR